MDEEALENMKEKQQNRRDRMNGLFIEKIRQSPKDFAYFFFVIFYFSFLVAYPQ